MICTNKKKWSDGAREGDRNTPLYWVPLVTERPLKMMCSDSILVWQFLALGEVEGLHKREEEHGAEQEHRDLLVLHECARVLIHLSILELELLKKCDVSAPIPSCHQTSAPGSALKAVTSLTTEQHIPGQALCPTG